MDQTILLSYNKNRKIYNQLYNRVIIGIDHMITSLKGSNSNVLEDIVLSFQY